MKRRQFLTGSAAAISAGISGIAFPQSSAPGNREKYARICISSWSFHNFFTSTRDENAPPLSGKPMDILDFPEMIADRYHVHSLEIVAPHFSSREPSYLKEVKGRLERAHSRLVNIPADIDELWDKDGLSAKDPKVREKAVSLYSPWIDVAQALGAATIRCDPGKVNPADPSPTIESYKTLVTRGLAKKIHIIVENHGGEASKHPEDLVKILKASGAGALPDIGNFPDEQTRERGLRLLYPLAHGVSHAKFSPKRFDFGRCIQIAREAGYKGVFSIEAEEQPDPYAETQQVLDQLLKYL